MGVARKSNVSATNRFSVDNLFPNLVIQNKQVIMKTVLFFDDWFLENRINVVRKQGQPEWRPDGIFEQSGIEGLGNFPTVERTKKGRWRAFYWSYRGGVRLLLAASEDGFIWHPLHAGAAVKLRKKKFRNEVFHGRDNCFTDSGPVFVEPDERDSERRYKTLYVDYSKGWKTVECGVATSPDGFNWRMEKVPWHGGWPDPPYCIFWRASDKIYVISCRPNFNDRRIAFVETSDWKTFTPPQLTLHPRPTDPPLVQYFAMPVFPYEDYYIGLLWFMHCDPYEVKESKIEGGIDCHLTYSYDGRMFNHCLAVPFIARNARGQHGSGCMYPSSMVEDDDGTLRIYSGRGDFEAYHAQKYFREWPDAIRKWERLRIPET
jgi:hypothetical protein